MTAPTACAVRSRAPAPASVITMLTSTSGIAIGSTLLSPNDNREPRHVMSADDLEAWRGVTSAARRRQLRASREVASALVGVCVPSARDVTLTTGDRGRPRLSDPSLPVDVSVSHTGDLVVVALAADRTVGVDVERCERVRYDAAFARAVCTAAERDDLARRTGVDRDRHLTWLWTVKEAVSKALGIGLRMSFASIAVSPVVPLRRAVARDGAGGWWSVRTIVHDAAFVTTVHRPGLPPRGRSESHSQTTGQHTTGRLS